MFSLAFEKTFTKHYAKLSKSERDSVDNKLQMLSLNPWHPSLRTKKIQSTEEFECSVSMDIRIAFLFDGDTIIVLLDIDHHDKLLQRRAR